MYFSWKEIISVFGIFLNISIAQEVFTTVSIFSLLKSMQLVTVFPHIKSKAKQAKTKQRIEMPMEINWREKNN